MCRRIMACRIHQSSREDVMKGKRKTSKTKWSLQAQFEAEAKRMMENRSKKAANRFLDALSPFVIEHEPAGRMAGS